MALRLRRRGPSVRASIRIGLGLLLTVVLSFVAVLPASAGDGTWTALGVGFVAVDPTNPDYLIGINEADLSWSADHGQTWTPASGVQALEAPFTFVFDPRNPDLVYLTSLLYGEGDAWGTYLYRSADHGMTWKLVLSRKGPINFDPLTPSIIYANGPAGVIKSRDLGRTWQTASKMFQGQRIYPKAVNPANPKLVLSSAQLRSGEDSSLLRSIDGGATWNKVNLPKDVKGVSFGPVYNSSGSVTFTLGSNCQVLRSTDDGKTWPTVSSISGSCWGILTNPLDPSQVFVSVTEVGVYRSTNLGESFTLLGSDLLGRWLVHLSIDRGQPQTLFINSSETDYSSSQIWAYTLNTTGVVQSTPRSALTASPTTVVSATSAATQIPSPTAEEIATPTPVPSSSSTPTPSVPPIAALAPSVTPASTPGSASSPDEQSTFGVRIVLVGTGAVVLAIGALAGRRLWRRSD